MRDLHQNPRPVARARVAPGGASVSQILENFEPVADDIVATDALQRRHESKAAGVVLELGVIKPLAGREGHVAGTSASGPERGPIRRK